MKYEEQPWILNEGTINWRTKKLSETVKWKQVWKKEKSKLILKEREDEEELNLKKKEERKEERRFEKKGKKTMAERRLKKENKSERKWRKTILGILSAKRIP